MIAARGRRAVSRTAARLGAALLGAALLAGCVSIPSEGPVVDAREVEGGRGGLIQLFPAGPSSGAGPGELIREFLRASAAYTNDHEVARSFLAPGQRVAWRPESPVAVYPGEADLSLTVHRGGLTATDSGPSPAAPSTVPSSASPSPSASTVPSSASPSASRSVSRSASASLSDAATVTVLSAPPQPGERVQVTVQVPVQARIDSRGEYRTAPPGTVETRHFDLVGTELGWRIASLDQGILVTRYDFSITFRGLPLYFADPSGTYLVPDVRWFPVSGTTSTPAQLLSALLEGPAEWLRRAVVTGVPPNTAPTVNAVKIADGVATVDLTTEARSADARQRGILKAQLERTLGGLGLTGTPVNRVVVTVEQQRFELQPANNASSDGRADAESDVGLRPPPQVDARPVVLDARGAIARLSGRTVEPVAGLAALALPGAVAPAVDAAGQAFAVLAAGRTQLVHAVPSSPARTLMRGQSLVAPSFDPFGWVWSAQERAGVEVLAARPEAGTARVRALWLAGLQVRSLRVSREGTRVVVVAHRPGGPPFVFVAGIVRTAQGVPTELGTPVPLLIDAQEATSAAWVDATHVVVLARRPGSPAMPWIVEVGGDAHQTLPVQAVAVTAGNSESDLYVQAAGGTVRSRVGSSWSDVPGVRWAAMPG